MTKGEGFGGTVDELLQADVVRKVVGEVRGVREIRDGARVLVERMCSIEGGQVVDLLRGAPVVALGGRDLSARSSGKLAESFGSHGRKCCTTVSA